MLMSIHVHMYSVWANWTEYNLFPTLPVAACDRCAMNTPSPAQPPLLNHTLIKNASQNAFVNAPYSLRHRPVVFLVAISSACWAISAKIKQDGFTKE